MALALPPCPSYLHATSSPTPPPRAALLTTSPLPRARPLAGAGGSVVPLGRGRVGVEGRGSVVVGGRAPVRVVAARRVSTGRSLVLNSTLVAMEGKLPDVQGLCREVLDMAHEKQSSKSSGIISFECHTDAYEGNVLYFWERYENFLSMNDFHASPEYTEFLTKVRPLLIQPVQLSAYEYNDGQIGCMLNPIGPKGEGGLDDATGQGGSGGGASYKQTSQSVSQGIGERDGWGLDNAVTISAAQNVAQEAAAAAAAALAKSFRTIFGGKGKP